MLHLCKSLSDKQFVATYIDKVILTKSMLQKEL